MSSTPTYKNLDALVEQPDSGTVASTRSGRSITKIYRAKYSVCVAAVKSVGTIGTGDVMGYSLESSVATRERGDLGKLTDIWSASGDSGDPGVTLPPDEIALSPGNISPRIELHKIFKPLDGQSVQVENESVDVFECARNAAAASTASERRKWAKDLPDLAIKMVIKMMRGNETFYLATLRYSWVTHSWFTPLTTRGGFIDAPGGPLAGYFVSDLQWLREGDDLQYSNGIWRLTRTWLGAPDGYWDLDLYG